MAPHSSTLAWRIHESWLAAVHGVAKSRTGLSDFTFTFYFHALEKEMATHSSVPAWRIPGTGKPGVLPSVGSHRVGHNWSDLAAAAWLTLKICWVAHSCPTPCDLLDFSLPGSFVLWIFQARIVEWVAIFSSMGSSPSQGSNLHLLCLLHCR